jgi:hypothetical protein
MLGKKEVSWTLHPFSGEYSAIIGTEDLAWQTSNNPGQDLAAQIYPPWGLDLADWAFLITIEQLSNKVHSQSVCFPKSIQITFSVLFNCFSCTFPLNQLLVIAA